MQRQPETWLLPRLRLLQSIKGSSDILSRIFVLAPVRKKTIAQVFVDHAAVRLDDFLAGRNPATDELGQFIAC